MAQYTGTMSTYDIEGEREDLEDIIYQISPEETPIVSAIGTTKVKATRHDWQTDALATPAANAHIEGDEYSYTARADTTRVWNYTQISRKTVRITETAEVVDKAGRDSEIAYQLANMGVELKKDIEFAILSNNAATAGDDNTPRVSAGLPAWLTSNVDRGSGGADGGHNGTTVVASTTGTLRAFTKAILDTVIEQTYVSGGNPKIVMVSPYNKRVFSGFMSDADIAQLRRASDGKGQGTLMAAADTYISDFGTLSVIPNRVMATSAAVARNVFVLDPSKAKRGVLRPIKTDTPARTGDATSKVLITEWTLVVGNEAAHGQAADVYGLTSST